MIKPGVNDTREFLETLLDAFIDTWKMEIREALDKLDFKAVSEIILSHKETIGKLEKMLGR